MQGLVAGLRLIDRFELIRRLGQGGMGDVWLARDAELGEDIALKILAPSLAAEDGYVELLKDECRKARRLVHPNIVRVYDIHSAPDAVFISMQYVDGESLAGANALGFAQVAADALVLCDALEYAHRSGLVHRDIKPANVMRDRGGTLYLGDFGIAAVPEDLAQRQPQGGGSLPYLSPQQIRGETPSIADDTYALGALMFELLSGHPPFHPDVTTDRILDEPAQIPDTDRTGQAIPIAFRNLVAACLEKTAELRPAGMGAVRAVLEEVHADFASDEIKPVRRRTARDETAAPATPTVLPDSGKKGLPAGVVLGALGLLAVVAVVVIFVLPSIVSERRAAAPRSELPAPAEPAQPQLPPAASDAQREIADEALGELLVLDGRLRDIGVTLWGGQDWLDARQAADAGDASYRERDFSQATVRYREALAGMKRLEPRAPVLLAEAQEDAQQAFDAGNQAEAVKNYELALAIDADNKTARAGLSRAMQLDRVLELMARARERESAGEIAQARAAYEEVLALDPRWAPAQQGAERTRQIIQTGNYQRQMAAGYAALERQQFDSARAAFRAALNARPGDVDAQGALRQLDSEQQLSRVVSLQSRAESFEDDERWADAVEQYQALLDVDATVAAAQQGLERARARVRLEQDLNEQISRSDRFYEAAVATRAREVLKRAQTVGNPGPALSAQIGELAGLLARSAIPVTVKFESDNLTDVMIYKIGRLGTFFSRDLSLKPGSYVAVGSREGYRDVRRNFKVSSDGSTDKIVLRCEEPI